MAALAVTLRRPRAKLVDAVTMVLPADQDSLPPTDNAAPCLIST